MELDHDVLPMIAEMRYWEKRRRKYLGKDHTRRALLLDRVLGTRRIASRSQLLQIPSNLLTDIVDMLADDKPALASLALVNSCCRQLARSSQFAEVCFDYSPQSQELLQKLLKEVDPQAVNGQEAPTIGACIRKFTLASEPNWLAYYNEELSDAVTAEEPEPFTATDFRPLEIANEEYERVRDIILTTTTHAMPNLEVLAWNDSYAIDQETFRRIMRSPAQHVQFEEVHLSEIYSQNPVPLQIRNHVHLLPIWPLRSLAIRSLMGSYRLWEEEDVHAFHTALLRRCASTLESLVWHHVFGITDYKVQASAISFGDEPIAFPRLRSLSFQSATFTCSAFLSFLSSPLRHLTLPEACDLNELKQALDKCDTLYRLESIVIPNLSMFKNTEHIVRFLERHSHIKELGVDEGDTGYLNPFLIPLLSHERFANLRSLSLRWVWRRDEGPLQTPEEAFSTIGTLTFLEQLTLAAGAETPFTWVADHDKLRTTLCGLKKLRKFAVFGDAYKIGSRPGEAANITGFWNWCSVAPTESDKDAAAMPLIDAEVGDEDLDFVDKSDGSIDPHWKLNTVVEKAHRNRMVSQAEKYAAVLPSLEWIYLGQRPMAIREDPNEPGRRAAIPLTNRRDSYHTILKETFDRITWMEWREWIII
ncbi:hypothetical protein F5Y04DRAFT_201264 [Hypomontagnella monticulosa]|nr:hypothetical protein F5Y04DRAFT_201264 [Hypomontagnella monticulosa]